MEWTINKFYGETELLLKTKLTLLNNANTYKSRKEISPINVSFEIVNFNISALQIKYIKIEEDEKSYKP